MNAKNKKTIDALKTKTFQIELDDIEFTCRKKNLLYILNSGKMPTPITNSLMALAGGGNGELEKISKALMEICDFLKSVIEDPETEQLETVFEYWDAGKIWELFNLYVYGMNSGVSVVTPGLLAAANNEIESAKN